VKCAVDLVKCAALHDGELVREFLSNLYRTCTASMNLSSLQFDYLLVAVSVFIFNIVPTSETAEQNCKLSSIYFHRHTYIHKQ